jgi:hypothetical protein
MQILPGQKIATPESIQQKMNNLTKLGPPRMKEFFVGLGLSGLGSNPHRLRAGKDISWDDLKGLLSEPMDRR